MLPCKKIYIDTHFKTLDSASNSQFKIELPETLTLPHNTIFYVDNISIPHSWYTIEENLNDRLYVQVSAVEPDPLLKPNHCKIVQLSPGHYNLAQLATEIVDRVNSEYGVIYPQPILTATTDSTTNTMKFFVASQYGTMEIKFLTDADLANGMSDLDNSGSGGWNGSWTGTSYNTKNPLDVNDILNFQNERGSFFTNILSLQTGYVDLQPIKNVYMYSPNLGTFTTIGPNKERSIIKKIPVSASNNQMIFDNVTSSSDYLDCSRQTLKTLEFQLKDVHGNIIPLHSSHVSFSIVFEKYRDPVSD